MANFFRVNATFAVSDYISLFNAILKHIVQIEIFHFFTKSEIRGLLEVKHNKGSVSAFQRHGNVKIDSWKSTTDRLFWMIL
jgi:hypothetical protein